MQFLNRILGTKTGKLAVGIILASAGAYLHGDLTGSQAVAGAIAGLYGMFQRDANLK